MSGKPQDDAETSFIDPQSESGAEIDRYHLLQRIGEGGMGEVWLAEQREPVRRRVALKLIKAGMNSRDLIARFESERQALAIMDHPAIAKVYDAGTTPLGLPYFVMEYVAGLPITTYCDKHKLSMAERLQLFVHVCEGVQHAHQKAIIHRDLKPSNILVKEEDGRAAPKIIDFGVAKALTQKLTEGTMYTQLGALIGTPEYMSPEQADSASGDIDTRTDVYSLGVILFELLVGVPPLDLRKSAYHELIRKLREEDAPKPSTKFRTLGGQTTAVARDRAALVPAYFKQLRGDLDSITLKSLEKDRARRYGSAAEFAADICRYLNQEPVLAVPASLQYRARKFAKRNRALVAAIGVVALVLIISTAVSVWLAVREARAERLAEVDASTAKAVNDFLQEDLLAQASPEFQTDGPVDSDIKVRTLVDRAAARVGAKLGHKPLVAAEIRGTIGNTYRNLGLYPQAEKQFQLAYDLSRQSRGAGAVETLQLLNDLATTKSDLGNQAEAAKLHNLVLEGETKALGDQDPRTLVAMQCVGVDYLLQGKYAAAEPLLAKALASQTRKFGYDNLETLNTSDSMASLYITEGKYPEAEALLAKGLISYQRVFGLEHPFTTREKFGLGRVLFGEGKYAQADELVSQVVASEVKLLGPKHPEVLWHRLLLGLIYVEEGKPEAIPTLEQVTRDFAEVVGLDNPDTLSSRSRLAAAYDTHGDLTRAELIWREILSKLQAQGDQEKDIIDTSEMLGQNLLKQAKFAEAEPFLRRALAARQASQPNGWRRFRSEALLGECLAGQKNWSAAEPLLLQGYEGMQKDSVHIPAADKKWLKRSGEQIVALYSQSGKPAQAAEWRAKL